MGFNSAFKGLIYEVKKAVLGWFSRTDKSFYVEAFQALVKRWDKSINVAGKYTIKYKIK